MAESKIQFFGEIDLNENGNIKSDMPAWYLDRHIEELEENIIRKQGMIDRQEVVNDQVPVLKEQIKADTARLKAINATRPHLEGKDLDRCAKAYEKLAKNISDTLPTRKQAKDGLVDPHRELKRLKTKHIPIDPTIAAACGVRPHQGKITGDEANKCYQILGKALGENTNPEALRRDGGVESYQTENDNLKRILDEVFRNK